MAPFEVPRPPVRPDAPPWWVAAALPVVGSLGTVALVINGGHRQMVIGMTLAAATLGAMVLQGVGAGAARRSHIRANRSRFRRDLALARTRLLEPPDPAGLTVVVGTSARRPDFVLTDDDPRADPVCVADRDRFLTAYSILAEAPHVLDLTSVRHLRADLGHARAVALAAAEGCAPEDLSIEVHTIDPDAWAWVAALPHHGRAAAHRLVIHDGTPAGADIAGTTRIEVVAGFVAAYAPDVSGPASAAARSRVLGARSTELEPTTLAWTVTLGSGPDGDVRVDLRESADGGVGPHGLLIGATGSGKSELLRQCLAELVQTHPADELHLALIDYKGGAAFRPFRDVPHTAAYVTNL
ncbi:MAG: FtsK/SpoIIIE domain-containing protein, partial [Bacillota bacterium]